MALNDVGIMAIGAGGLMVLPSGVTLRGLGWSVDKAPTMQTRIQRAVSGRELRAMDYPFPLWQFSLTFNFLRDQWDSRGSGFGAGFDEARTLYAFYLACYGAFGTFLFDDPTDNARLGQAIGAGDGVTTQFQLSAQYGAGPTFADQVRAVQSLSTIYFNGVAQSPSIYSCATGLNSTGVVTFTSPPSPGVAITADFAFYFRCRFIDDSYTFKNFMLQLFSLKQLNFISVF